MYNKENLLKRIIEVQNIVLEHQKKGIQQRQIYNKFVRDVYHISYSTFNKWLGCNAKQELKKKF
jgi:uncharacterized membrane-anchored protein